jgi:hypothetical protein
MKVFDFCLLWSLASIKSTRFKTFISESIVRFKIQYQAKKVMKFRVLKVESANSTMSGSQSFRGSFMIPVTTLIM